MNKRMLGALSLAVLLLLTVTVVIVFSNSNSPLVDDSSEVIGGIESYHLSRFDDDPRKIYIVNKSTAERKLIYETAMPYIEWVSLSPNRTFIAGIEPVDPLTNRLLILNSRGDIIHLIDDNVRRYGWSPDGAKITYITGTNYEGGEGFKPTGVFLFLIKEGVRTQIADRAYYVNWARFDSCIYYNDLKQVYRYNPVTRITEQTTFNGLYFSPDDKYYIALTSEDGPYLYVTATNVEITDRVKSRFGYLPQSWLPQEDHHLLVVKVEYEPSPIDTVKNDKPRVYLAKDRKIRQKTFYIYDVDQDQITKEWIE